MGQLTCGRARIQSDPISFMDVGKGSAGDLSFLRLMFRKPFRSV